MAAPELSWAVIRKRAFTATPARTAPQPRVPIPPAGRIIPIDSGALEAIMYDMR